jgi:hypothetical protein
MGHLSNEQTSAALLRILDDSPRWVWLAHLSRTNNRPELARTHLCERLRANGLRHIDPKPLPPQIGPTWDSAQLWAPKQPRLAGAHEATRVMDEYPADDFGADTSVPSVVRGAPLASAQGD